jgi:hypothetical protein
MAQLIVPMPPPPHFSDFCLYPLRNTTWPPLRTAVIEYDE